MTQPLLVGDPLPARALTDPQGARIDLGHPRYAGHLLLLCLITPPNAAALRAALEPHEETLRTMEALTLFVCRTPDPSMRDLCVDQEGLLFTSEDPQEEGLLLADRDGHIAARIAPSALESALALAWSIHAQSTPNVVQRHAPVLVLRDVLEPALCLELMAFWETQPKTANAVTSRHQGNAVAYESAKRRKDVVVDDPALIGVLRARLARRMLPDIRKAYRMDIVSTEALRVGCYDALDSGAFARHRDNSTPFTAHRRLAVSINLNTGSYVGGELCFPEYGRALYNPPAGGAVVFSCGLLHEALPVTDGRRFGLFTFLKDRAGAEEERRMRIAQNLED